MSLNWNISAIENAADLWTDDPVYPDHKKIGGRTECLIWATIFVGMDKITAENWLTFASRVAAWERATGPLSTSGEPITAAEVKRHIGLTTNASTKTLAAFERSIGRAVLDTAKAATERSQKEQSQ